MRHRASWSERLVAWLLPDGVAEEVLGDLREEWSGSATDRPNVLVRGVVVLSIVLRLHARSWSRETLLRHVRLAGRRMRLEPRVTVIFVTAMALGVGVNMVMLSVANAVLFAPLPFPDPDRLAVLSNDHRGSSTGGFGVAYESVRDIRERVPSIEQVGLYLDWQDVTYDDGDAARRLAVAFVSGEYAEMLGLEASLGRLFDPSEVAENAPGRVAVLGQGAWTSLFGADRAVLGRTLTLNGSPYEIVGVTSDDRGDLRYLWQQDPVQLYLPLFAAEELIGVELDGDRGNRSLSALARMREGATLEVARMELEALSQQLDATFPRTNEGWSYHLEGLHDEMFSELSAPVAVIVGISLLVLLLVGVNLATLSLLRVTGRIRGVAIRRAMGASRGGIVAQSLAESSVVAIAALAVATVGARWGLSAFAATTAIRLPSFSSTILDLRVLSVGIGLTVGFALFLGLLPATVALGGAGSETLGSGTRGSSTKGGGSVQKALVSAQVAVAVVLLLGAGLLLRSYMALTATEYGFRTDRLLVAQVDVRSESLEPDRLQEFANGLVLDVEALPWVEAALMWGPNRLGHGNRVAILAPEGRWVTMPELRFEASRHSVRPGDLALLGVELLAGRDIAPGDVREGPRVAVISESMARVLWPGADPIGKRMETQEGGERVSVEVVGVAADARHRTRMVDPFGAQRDVYYPFTQVYSGLLSVLVRYQEGADLDAIVAGVRRAVRERSTSAPVYGVTTMEDQMRAEEGPARVAAAIVVLYAGLAMALAALGLFGVLSHAVRLRAKEISIRKALGAEQRTVVWAVVRGGLLLTAAGIGIGTMVAIPASRMIQGALYGVEPNQPSIVLLVWVTLVLIAGASCWVPARLAAAVPPAEVLRAD